MDSLLKLKADGHKIFIATGRHRKEMAALDIDWSFFDGFVTLNGAVNYDRDFSFISAYPFDSAARDSVVSILIEKRIPLFVVQPLPSPCKRSAAWSTRRLSTHGRMAVALHSP